MRKILFLLSIFALSQYVLGRQANSRHPNLVGSWHFNEGSGTHVTDSSGNSNYLTLNGGAWVSGKYNKGFSSTIANDQARTALVGGGLDGASEFSATMWVNLNAPLQENTYFFDTYTNPPATRSIFIQGITSLGSDFWVSIRDAEDDITSIEITNGEHYTVRPGEWNFYAFTWKDNGWLRIYFNGKLIRSAKVLTAGVLDSQEVTGATFFNNGSGGHKLNGVSDEVNLYNKQLTEGELADIYADEGGRFLN